MTLVANRYGKSQVRVLRVARVAGRHVVEDLTIDVRLEGAFGPSYTDGDNRLILPTDSMANAAYALAQEHCDEGMEPLGLRLATYLVESDPHVRRAEVEIRRHPWQPVVGRGVGSYVGAGNERRTAFLARTADASDVRAGVEGLRLMKTSGSAFRRFRRDRYTTLPDTDDRVLVVSIDATWTYGAADVEYDRCWRTVRRILVETFAAGLTESVQHSVFSMGRAVLDGCPQVDEIGLVASNLHCHPVDLAPLGVTGTPVVFRPIEEPHGRIEARLVR